MDPDGVPPVAAAQAGVFTAAQATAAGWSARQVRRRVDHGRWIPVAGRGLADRRHPVTELLMRQADVLRSGERRPPPPHDLGRQRAALAHALAWAALLTWPGGVVGGTVAAGVHGWPVDLTRPVRVHLPAYVRPREDLLAVRSRLREDEVEVHPDGVVVTGTRRTALECLLRLDVDSALDLWAWLSTRTILTRQDLSRDARAWYGRPGRTRLDHLLALTRTGAGSAAEVRLHTLLSAAGLSGWVAGARVEDGTGVIGVVDVLFPGARLVVEVDGWRAHGGREAFVRDRRRQNRLVAAGYTVLRVTWDDLVERPQDVVDQVGRLLGTP